MDWMSSAARSYVLSSSVDHVSRYSITILSPLERPERPWSGPGAARAALERPERPWSGPSGPGAALERLQ